MVYVALLRGVNVGGNRKVEMAKLKQVFEELGFEKVKTFINSGNVIFVSDSKDEGALTQKIEAAIEKGFGFSVDVLLRNIDEMAKLVKTIPDDWVTDNKVRCYVLFLWSEIDSEDILEKIPHKPEIEQMLYIPGAAIHRIDAANATRGRMVSIIGTPLYKQLTMRNSNSVRKIYDLMKAAES
ncbi:MAG TPA: DUF1697 domain-containing protein [Candidatus Saccharimonadia bacterium]|nr:DUF1697 domain-containing protein [Candidatus Saccharimonadia bacterium]